MVFIWQTSPRRLQRLVEVAFPYKSLIIRFRTGCGKHCSSTRALTPSAKRTVLQQKSQPLVLRKLFTNGSFKTWCGTECSLIGASTPDFEFNFYLMLPESNFVQLWHSYCLGTTVICKTSYLLYRPPTYLDIEIVSLSSFKMM